MNNMIITSLLNNISEVNLRNNNINNNLNSNSFDNILKNSLVQSSNCSCNNKSEEISTLTTIISTLNSMKIHNSTVNNIDNDVENTNSIESLNINNDNITSSSIDKAITLASEQIGKPYVWGANGPSSFDCSGLTSYIYKEAFGKSLPRTSYEQSKYGNEVNKSDLQPGDLVFFDTMNKGRVSHVGIYIGNDEFIHASNPRDGVKKSSLNSSYYQKTYKGARRP